MLTIFGDNMIDVWVYVNNEDEKEFENILKKLGFTIRKGSLLELREGFNTIKTNPRKGRKLALKYYPEDFDEVDESMEDFTFYALFVE